MTRSKRKKKPLTRKELEVEYPNEKYIDRSSIKKISGYLVITLIALVILIVINAKYGFIKPTVYSTDQQKILDLQAEPPRYPRTR